MSEKSGVFVNLIKKAVGLPTGSTSCCSTAPAQESAGSCCGPAPSQESTSSCCGGEASGPKATAGGTCC